MAKGTEIRDAALVTLLDRERARLHGENDHAAAELMALAIERIRLALLAETLAPVNEGLVNQTDAALVAVTDAIVNELRRQYTNSEYGVVELRYCIQYTDRCNYVVHGVVDLREIAKAVLCRLGQKVG